MMPARRWSSSCAPSATLPRIRVLQRCWAASTNEQRVAPNCGFQLTDNERTASLCQSGLRGNPEASSQLRRQRTPGNRPMCARPDSDPALNSHDIS